MITKIPSHDGHWFGPRWFALLLVALLLVSCNNDSGTPDDRHFANDPADEQPIATETPSSTPLPTPTRDTSPKASPASILKTRGAPKTIYLLSADGITALTTGEADASETSWGPSTGKYFAAMDDAPDGSRVAAIELPLEAGSGTADLVVFDAAGGVSFTAADVLDLAAVDATPVSDGTSGAPVSTPGVFVSWSPLGNQILIGAADGQLHSVSLAGGEAVTFTSDTPLSGLQMARWSPHGSIIGALVRDNAGNGHLLSLTADGSTLTSEELVRADSRPNANSIELFQWSADGSSVLYVATRRENRQPSSGQLFRMDLKSGATLLVATAGRAGPSGIIASIDLSPDGRSIAYVIAVRDGDRQTFHSLVIKSLRDDRSYDVPVTSNAVPGVWWVSQGLVWDQTMAGDPRFVLVRPNGDVVEIAPAEPGATPAGGTPVTDATPGSVATPEAAG
jgi:hypothetical protein